MPSVTTIYPSVSGGGTTTISAASAAATSAAAAAASATAAATSAAAAAASAANVDVVATTAYDQTVIGDGAMPTQTSGTIYNIAIGTEALRDATTTYATVAIGYHAGASEEDGRTGVYVGHVAGEFINSGSSNTAIGGYAMRGVAATPMTGVDNTAVGEACMINLRGAANYNTAMGFNALFGLQDGDSNTAIGLGAGLSLTTTSGNSMYGLGSYQWGNGSNNVVIGYNAGEGYTFTKTTNAITAEGGTTVYFADTSDVNIGDSLYAGAYIYPGALVQSKTASSVTLDTGSFNAIPSGATITVIPDQHTGARNVIIGYFAGNQISGAVDDITYVGYAAARFMTTGLRNTAIGAYTLNATTTQNGNTAIGYRAGRYVASADNTFIGDQAGRSTSGTNLSGANNVGIGVEALADIQGAAASNVGIGYRAALNITTGSTNILIGANTAATLTTGSSNIIIGNSLNVAAAGTANTLNIGGLITGTGTYGTGTQSLAFAGAVTMPEQSDAAAPDANSGVFYMRDNGAGKTQFCVRFPTGAVQVIATEP